MQEEKKLNIVFDANPLIHTKSGVGYFTHGIIEAIAEAGRDTIHLTGFYSNFLGRKQIADLPERPNISYKELRYFPTKIVNGLRRFGIQLPLDVFVPQKADIAFFPNFITVPTIRKTLRTVVVHDLSFVDCPEYVAARNGSFLRKWVPRYVKGADVVFTISEFTKQRIMDEYGVPKEKIYVLPIPPAPHAVADESILKKFDLERGYLLFVGNIEPRKNIIGLLGAYETFPTELAAAFPLVLVGGKGWNDQEIMDRLESIKQKGLPVIQTGYVTDEEKAALFKHATVFVQPSHYEGFGMPILEAMSYGRPVACSDIPVFHEVAGDAAVFFDQTNPDDMATVIAALLRDKNKQKLLSTASRKRVDGFMSWHDVAEDFLRIIQKSSS